MKILNKGKTNLKYILIIIILASILIGIILDYSKKQSSNEDDRDMIEENISMLLPVEVVKKFIEAEMAGVWLGGEIRKEMPDIFSYLYEPYEPGDRIMIISDYEIINEYENNNSYFVRVKFFCEKIIASGSTGFPEEKVIDGGALFSFTCSTLFSSLEKNSFKVEFDYKEKTETHNFELIKTKKGWKIKPLESIFMPNSSNEALIKHLEKL